MNKQKIEEIKKIEEKFSKKEFPILLDKIGKNKLRAFILCVKLQPVLTKTTFLNELTKETKNLSVEFMQKTIEELDRFFNKVLNT